MRRVCKNRGTTRCVPLRGRVLEGGLEHLRLSESVEKEVVDAVG